MGLAGGANTATDGLVFYYDTGNLTRSYIGEPTTNLIPNAPVNALPTFGNGWGTYNTNQYGNGNFWAIPAISSVSNNIVTTVSAHPMRSFDVLRPQTTGGGLTANTDYLVKKISDTQFSLHAYNGSQDGSQGYINPSTGGFKVHDSYWFDQRVSVNATSFPTMWWGAPHLPNSAIVKEIIVDGFDVNPSRKTNCIRLHWFRTDATDGMAYGVDAPLTIGEPTTVSFWARAANQSAVGQNIGFQNYNYGGPAGYSYFGMSPTWGAVGEWVRNSYTFTPTHTAIISYWFPSTGGMKVDIANIQVEHKSHRTAFTTGTRSVTEGLLDMTGNNTIDLSNISFDSNSKIVLDGTDDYIDTTKTPSQLGMYDSSYTAEAVCYPTSLSNDKAIFGTDQTAYRQGLHLTLRGGVLYMGHYSADYSAGTADINAWNHIVYRYDASTSTASIFKNGILQGSGTIASFIGTTNVLVGREFGAHNFAGEIPLAKIYNRALTADEIQQNFLAYKTRFGI